MSIGCSQVISECSFDYVTGPRGLWLCTGYERSRGSAGYGKGRIGRRKEKIFEGPFEGGRSCPTVLCNFNIQYVSFIEAVVTNHLKDQII